MATPTEYIVKLTVLKANSLPKTDVLSKIDPVRFRRWGHLLGWFNEGEGGNASYMPLLWALLTPIRSLAPLFFRRAQYVVVRFNGQDIGKTKAKDNDEVGLTWPVVCPQQFPSHGRFGVGGCAGTAAERWDEPLPPEPPPNAPGDPPPPLQDPEFNAAFYPVVPASPAGLLSGTVQFDLYDENPVSDEKIGTAYLQLDAFRPEHMASSCSRALFVAGPARLAVGQPAPCAHGAHCWAGGSWLLAPPEAGTGGHGEPMAGWGLMSSGLTSSPPVQATEVDAAAVPAAADACAIVQMATGWTEGVSRRPRGGPRRAAWWWRLANPPWLGGQAGRCACRQVACTQGL